MKQDELLRDADRRLKSFDEAKTVREAEPHYRALSEILIPAIDAEDHTMGAAVERAFRELVAQRVARRYIPAT